MIDIDILKNLNMSEEDFLKMISEAQKESDIKNPSKFKESADKSLDYTKALMKKKDEATVESLKDSLLAEEFASSFVEGALNHDPEYISEYKKILKNKSKQEIVESLQEMSKDSNISVDPVTIVTKLLDHGAEKTGGVLKYKDSHVDLNAMRAFLKASIEQFNQDKSDNDIDNF